MAEFSTRNASASKISASARRTGACGVRTSRRRAWGTVREDYSAYGDAWDFLPHDQARSRAYRWSEDGLGGISDENQFSVPGSGAVERPRSVPQGARVRADRARRAIAARTSRNTTSTSTRPLATASCAISTSIRRRLILTNGWSRRTPAATATARRSTCSTPASSTAAGTSMSRWFTARRAPRRSTFASSPTIAGRRRRSCISCPPCGSATPGPGAMALPNPTLRAASAPAGAAWLVQADHPQLGTYYLYGRQPAELLVHRERKQRRAAVGSAERHALCQGRVPSLRRRWRRAARSIRSASARSSPPGTRSRSRPARTFASIWCCPRIRSRHRSPAARSSSRPARAKRTCSSMNSCPRPARRIIGSCARRSPA